MSEWWEDSPVVEDQSEWWKTSSVVTESPDAPVQTPTAPSGDIQEDKRRMLKYAQQDLGQSWFPNAKTTAIRIGSSVLAPAQRLFSGESADWTNRWADAYETAARELDKGGMVPEIIKRGVRGAATTVPTMVLAARAGGPYAAIGLAAGQEADQAITEGKEAGLKGAKLGAYSITQGVIEGAVASVFQAVGLGGLEKVAAARATTALGIKQALKQAGKSTLQELPEEIITEVGHNAAKAVAGVDPNAVGAEAIANTIADTTVQTIITCGFVNSPGLVSSMIEKPQHAKAWADSHSEEAAAIAGQDSPSRSQWEEAGLPKGVNAETRKAFADTLRSVPVARIAPTVPVARIAPGGEQALGDLQAPPDATAGPQTGPVADQGPLRAFPVRTDAVGQVAEQVEPVAAAEQPTSTKGAVVDEIREERGDAPIPPAEKQSQQQWLDEAGRRMDEDRAAGIRLVRELKETPRPVQPEEEAVLQRHYRRLNNDFARVSDQLFAASEAGDAETAAVLQSEAEEAFLQLQGAEEAVRGAGRQWGRAGVARQIELYSDYTLSNMARRARIAKRGERLTAEESEKIQELNKRIVALEGEIERRKDEEAGGRVQKEIDSAVQEVAKTKRRIPTRKKKAAAKRIEKAWAGFKEKFAALGQVGAVLDPEQEASKQAELIGASVEVVKAYVDLGVVTFSDFMARARKHLGAMAEKSKASFLAAWNQVKAEGGIPLPDVDPADLAGISRFARKLTRSFVEAGMTERDAVVTAVHEELKAIVPEITRRETADAMSGYGDFHELSKDAVSVKVREIRGQLQQLSKIDDLVAAIKQAKAWLASGMSVETVAGRLEKSGLLPKKTGVERRTADDIERHLIAEVNELKKQIPVPVSGRENQLKSALDAAKTAVRNRIADLETEIRTRERIVRDRTELKPDAELTSLRQQRDQLAKLHAELFPKAPATQAQRIAAAEKALDRTIAQLQADLAAGRIGPKANPAKLSSPTLDAKRAHLDSLRALRDELREAANPKMTPEERANLAYKRILLKRLGDLRQRIANKDFGPRPPKSEKTYSKEVVDLRFELDKEKTQFRKMEEEWKRANRSLTGKVADVLVDIAGASRGLMVSGDIPLFRQGFVAALFNPARAIVGAGKAVNAMWTGKGLYRLMAELETLPTFQFGQRSGLAITDTTTVQEENFLGRWNKKIWPIAVSERVSVAFLNYMRAKTFDAIVRGEELTNGKLTADQGKVIALLVNESTGRGPLGGWERSVRAVNNVFFSAQNWVSKFQLLAGHPFWAKGSDVRTRKIAAKFYGRSALSLAAFYGLAQLGMALLWDDDDPNKPTIAWDPTSSDFGKIRIGDRRVDPLGGLSQAMVFIARSMKRAYLFTTGEPRTRQDQGDEYLWRFARSKLAPIPGATVDILSGKEFGQEKSTPASIARNLVMPMTADDVARSLVEDGMTRDAAWALVGIIGMNTMKYADKPPKRRKGSRRRLAVQSD